MVLKEEKDRIRTLISETLTLMCKNGLNYKAEFSIDALVGITLDQKEEFFLSIKDGFSFRPVIEEDNGIPQTPKKNNYSQRQESVDEPPSPIKDVEGEENEHEAKSSRRKRKRRRSSEAYSDNTGDQAANGAEEANKANNKPEIITNFSLQDLQQLHDNAADELWTSITGEGEENASSSPSQRGANASCSEPAAAVKKPHVDDETSYSSMSETGGRTPVTPASVKQESYAQEEDDEESEVLYIKDEPESDDNDASNDQAYGAKHYPIDSSPRGHASSSFMPPHHITPAAHHSSFNASAWNPALSMQQNTPGNISRQSVDLEASVGSHGKTGAGTAWKATHQGNPLSGVRPRRGNWTDEETGALLELWLRPDMQSTLVGCRRFEEKIVTYCKMANVLWETHGIHCSGVQIGQRIKNLKHTYCVLKNKQEEDQLKWKFWNYFARQEANSMELSRIVQPINTYGFQ